MSRIDSRSHSRFYVGMLCCTRNGLLHTSTKALALLQRQTRIIIMTDSEASHKVAIISTEDGTISTEDARIISTEATKEDAFISTEEAIISTEDAEEDAIISTEDAKDDAILDIAIEYVIHPSSVAIRSGCRRTGNAL